jgi:hypothetical protein
MDQIYPDSTLVPQLARIASNSLTWHLYTNVGPPDLSYTLGSFTEAGWAGYTPQTVAPASFTTTGVSGHLGYMIAGPVSFGNTSGVNQQAYGYFITDAVTGDLVGCAQFDSAPITIVTGGTYQVVPLLANQSALSS